MSRANRTLRVGNLPGDIREREVEDLFCKYGPIAHIDLKIPPKPPGYAFVEFEEVRDAEDAIRGCNGYDFGGHRIQVELAHSGCGHCSSVDSGYSSGSGPGDGVSRHSDYRVLVTGLPPSASWEDLKDHMRAGDVCFSQVLHEGSGHKIEKSFNEVAALPSGTETACCLVLNEREFPFYSVNGSVTETKEIIEHKDDNGKSLELQQSSESTDSLTPLADSGIVQRPVGSDENVFDIARELEHEYKASPSMENVAANIHEIVKPGTGDADNVAVECVEDALELTTEHGTEHAPSCLTGNGAATAKEVIEQETEVENSEGAISSPVSCSQLKSVTKDVNDTTIGGGYSTNYLTDKVIASIEFELETPGPQSSDSINSFTLAADSSIVQRPVGSDGNVLDIAREHEAEYKASPSMENVAANTHEIIKLETGDADNVAVERVEDASDLTTEPGTEHMPPPLTENDAATDKEIIEQDTEVENFEGAVSSLLSCSKSKPITEDINYITIAGGDSTSCSIDKMMTSMEFELETSGPQSSESTNSLTLAVDSNIVQSAVGSDENVLDIAGEHEAEYEASPLMENVAANTHEIKPETGDADNVAVECVADTIDLTTERGREHVPSCFTGNDAATATDVIEQETEVENFEGAISSLLRCSKLKPITEDVNDTTIAGGDSTSCLIDKVMTSMEFELETPGPQSSGSTNSLTLAAESSIVQSAVGSDENVLDIAREHEAEYKASPSMENVTANTHERIKPETGDADNFDVECVVDAIDLITERGREHVPSCFSGNDAATAKDVIEQETEVENFEGAVSSPLCCSKLKPITGDVNDTTIAGGDSTSCLIDAVMTSMEFELETPGPQSSGSTDKLTIVADSSIVQRAFGSDENVLDIAREHEDEYKASPSMENVTANTHERIQPQTRDADNVAVECVEDAVDLTTERGREHVPSCFTGNDAATAKEVIEQETEVENFEGAVSSPVSCSKLKPIAEDVNDTTVAGGDIMEFELETPGPLSSGSTDSLTLESDSSIVQRAVGRDENVLDIAREHEAEYKASPSIENVAVNTHEIIKPETGDADNVAVECVEDAVDLPGREHEPSCFTGNDAATANEVFEQEAEVENFEGAVSSPVSCSKLKPMTEDVNDTGGNSTSCSIDKVITSIKFDLETPGPQDVSTLHDEYNHLKTEISIVDVACSDSQSVPSGTEKEFEVGSCNDVISCRDMLCNNVASGNDVSDSFVRNDKLPNCVLYNVDIGSKGEHLAHVKSDDKLMCQETRDVENSLKNGKSMPLLENSCAGAVAVHHVVEPLTRPFQFLIRMPRFEDFKIKEQIRKAQLLVDEKTQLRDAIRIEVQKYKANCIGYAAEYDAAVDDSRTLKRAVKAKRAEIDSLQSVINKVKNAISVDDIDARIHGMEHMIEHETLPLKEEKLLIREIKHLKQLREQLSSNIGNHDEVQQALNNRDQIEERFKVLKKELESLKDSVLKADAVARALEKKYADENKKVKEVQTQYATANNIRQDAYAQLQSLRKQLFEKNQQFRMYKDNAAAASDYAAKRDREALHRLCVNQVESIMELWNQNNEFRKEYVRCNMKSTLRRLGTMDGRSLGPFEQPHVLTNYGDERVVRLVSNPVNSGPTLQTRNLEQDVVEPVQDVRVGDKIKVKESEQKIPATRPRKQEEHVLRNDLATASGREITDDDIREERHRLTEEELNLARKVEELRKEEAAAKLKEQRRLEERAKALEALEKKKRNAEKAQMRAELRAQKEAEQREKEREKRLRKKERRKVSATEVPDGNNVVETTPNCESLMETMKEPEIKENSVAVSKRPQKTMQFTKQSKAKSIPPPLRNRSRRKIQQWMWVILTCLLVVALFLLGNVGFFSNLSNLRRRNSGV